MQTDLLRRQSEALESENRKEQWSLHQQITQSRKTRQRCTDAFQRHQEALKSLSTVYSDFVRSAVELRQQVDTILHQKTFSTQYPATMHAVQQIQESVDCLVHLHATESEIAASVMNLQRVHVALEILIQEANSNERRLASVVMS